MISPDFDPEYAKLQFQIHQMYAQWWMVAATNGHAGTRKVSSINGLLSPEQLRDDAMNTAKNHIHICSEIMEHLGEYKEQERGTR